MKFLILILTSIVWSDCLCQDDWDIIKEAKNLPIANNKATVKGFTFDKTLLISKDSLKNGFSVALQDPTYKIAFFRLTYVCENCDIWVKTIYGDLVTVKDAPILKEVKKGEFLSLNLFKIGKEKKYFTLPEVVIIVTD
jgi:hypothetical protein